MSAGRVERRELVRRRILEAAWDLSRSQGLTGWGVRELGARVGMRAPSLYVYFASKNDIFDAMFAQGYREFGRAFQAIRESQVPPEEKLRVGAHHFFEFAVYDSARMQLLFLRVIPSFVPSEDSFALARESFAELESALGEAGVHDSAAVDLWTATLTGLATQQVSNDPGGRRWADLVDTAVDMLLTATRRAGGASVHST